MNDGDFIEIDFVGRVKDTGEIFDLTDEGIAKKEGVYDKDHKYGPALVVIGQKSVIAGVEEKLKEMSVGEEKEFDLKPEKAFGKRDPKLIQIIAVNKFYEQKLNPVPGAFVSIEGRNCKIQSVSGGRVRVDFNHSLAGREIFYKVRIIREIKSIQEKADSVIKQLGIEAEASIEGEAAKVKLKKSSKVMEQIVEKSIKKWVKEIKTVNFEEERKEGFEEKSAEKKA